MSRIPSRNCKLRFKSLLRIHDCCTFVLPSVECDCISRFIWLGVDTGDDNVYGERYMYICIQKKNMQGGSIQFAAWEETTAFKLTRSSMGLY